MDKWTDIFMTGCRNLFEWGPGMIFALIMLYGLYILIRGIGMKIVGALEKPTSALNSQAHSMDMLTKSLQEYITRDRSEHREIIVLLKVNAERLDNIMEKLREAGNG